MLFNLQTKLFLLLAGLTTLVLVIVLIAVNNVATTTITKSVVADFKQTQGIFQRTQALRYDRLVESAFLIQENSTFKANVDLDDPSSMQYVVEAQFAPFVKADLFIVTNAEGKVLAWLGHPEKEGVDLSKQPTINNALQENDPPLDIIWPDLWAVDNTLHQVVSVPIYTGTKMIGTITLGAGFTNTEATNLMQNTQLNVTFVLNMEPFSSSSGSIDTSYVSHILNRSASLIDSVVTQRISSDPFRSMHNGESYFNFISPLGKGEKAFYIASVPVSIELQMLDSIQSNIFIIALFTILLVIPMAVFLGKIISDPIKSLSKAMLNVRQGNLDVSVENKYNDEIGVLSQSFNDMIIGLRERFTLQKYVGGHTLEMLKKSSEQEIKLGGTRKELAILFTDIRNSTRVIQENEPEEFIVKLNKTLTSQAEYVSYFNGSIDKFIGDSMVALFGGEDALKRASQCAVAIQKQFNVEHADDPFFDGVGIGLNFGSIVLGNMGVNERMDYTVIGSEVNLCARLCSAADIGEILLPENIAVKYLEHTKIKFKSIEQQTFKGFSEELEIVKIDYD